MWYYRYEDIMSTRWWECTAWYSTAQEKTIATASPTIEKENGEQAVDKKKRREEKQRTANSATEEKKKKCGGLVLDRLDGANEAPSLRLKLSK